MEGEFIFFYLVSKRPLFLMNSCNPHRPLPGNSVNFFCYILATDQTLYVIFVLMN